VGIDQLFNDSMGHESGIPMGGVDSAGIQGAQRLNRFRASRRALRESSFETGAVSTLLRFLSIPRGSFSGSGE
jgi:hypothetical protein